MRQYRLLEDDPRFRLVAGDILECRLYTFEPDCKLTVVKRVRDGFVPHCNVYRHQVVAIREDGSEHKLSCTCCG